MNDRELIQKALSGLHASAIDLKEVMNMSAQNQSRKKLRKTTSALLLAAIILVMSSTAAFAADYVINHRSVFFFDTIAALTEAQRMELPPSAANYSGVPGSLKENRKLETPAQLVTRYLEQGKFGSETVLADETDPTAESLWERRMESTSTHDYYGDIQNEYLAGEAYAGKLVIEGLLEWDLASMTAVMTPEEGGQIIVSSRDASDGKLVMTDALLGYRTEEGERFQIYFSHDADSRFVQDSEYVLSSAFDEAYIYTTRDGVEVLIELYDGQIWAQTANADTGNEVHFYTTGCTAAQMEEILDSLSLSIPLCANV